MGGLCAGVPVRRSSASTMPCWKRWPPSARSGSSGRLLRPPRSGASQPTASALRPTPARRWEPCGPSWEAATHGSCLLPSTRHCLWPHSRRLAAQPSINSWPPPRLPPRRRQLACGSLCGGMMRSAHMKEVTQPIAAFFPRAFPHLLDEPPLPPPCSASTWRLSARGCVAISTRWLTSSRNARRSGRRPPKRRRQALPTERRWGKPCVSRCCMRIKTQFSQVPHCAEMTTWPSLLC